MFIGKSLDTGGMVAWRVHFSFWDPCLVPFTVPFLGTMKEVHSIKKKLSQLPLELNIDWGKRTLIIYNVCYCYTSKSN